MCGLLYKDLMVQVQIRIELVLGKVILPNYAYKAIKKQKFTENYKLHLLFDKSVHIFCIEIISSSYT